MCLRGCVHICVCVSSKGTNVSTVVEDTVQTVVLALSFSFWALLVIG